MMSYEICPVQRQDMAPLLKQSLLQCNKLSFLRIPRHVQLDIYRYNAINQGLVKRSDDHRKDHGRGEWRGGIAPPRSRRTGHDTLASSGSHCSAAAIE